MNRALAALVAVGLGGAAYAVMVALTDRIFLDTAVPPGRGVRAALAMRDDVTPFQKWGSRNFTANYLERYYDAAWYFTQTSTDDCRQQFRLALAEALAHYRAVDLFLLAHSNTFVTWVAGLPPALRRRLRLVYNTGCGDLGQGPLWLHLGAKAYVGHPGASASPVFYFYFLRRWTRGRRLGEVLDEANGLMDAALQRAELLSLGNLDAHEAFEQSRAFCCGDDRLRLQGVGR
jgi:hypothetical protein